MGSDLTAAKAEARRAGLARRKAAHDPAAGLRACDRLLAFLGPREGHVIAGYMPIRTEIDILPAMAALARRNTVCVPVITGPGEALDFHAWTPEMAMTPGPFGANVPVSARAVTPDIVIVPLVAFDRRGHRLGYGGGYYDRTLARLRGAGTVLAAGFAYADQEAGAIPVERTDQRLDAVVTEREVLRFG